MILALLLKSFILFFIESISPRMGTTNDTYSGAIKYLLH